jgi:peroxiredoxin
VTVVAAIGLTVCPSVRLSAQEPVKAHLMGDPLPGRPAPAFSLPYVTAEGPGPAGQPFVLQAELGRVVVLAFCAGTADSAAVSLLRTFATRREDLFPGDVVVAGILPGRPDTLERVARDMALPYKLLPDANGSIRRMFGVGPRQVGVYVIGLDGRVVWREIGFNPFLATGYEEIRRAVQQAGKL